MIDSPKDPYLIPAPDMEAMAKVYRATELHDEALILQLMAIRRTHPELLHCQHGPDADLCENAQAGLTELGRSLVNAFMAGQIHAYRQVREFTDGYGSVCVRHLRKEGV